MLIKRMLVATIVVLTLSGCAKYSTVRFKKSTVGLAVTSEQRTLAVAQEKLVRQPLEQLGGYLDAADAARMKLARDPGNTLVRSDYNFAVARVMDAIYDNKLAPWDRTIVAPSSTGHPWRLRLVPPFKQQELQPALFQFRPSDRYDFAGKGVGERVLKEGLGAPLVVVGKDLDYLKLDKFAQGKNLYYGMTALVNFRGRNCEIELLDPLARETVRFDGQSYPLAGDYQGPLALALADLHLERRELAGLFQPQKFEGKARLARLQPYDPRKIPVVCIHGLGNSPATWAPLIEFLRGDPAIREHYQFWFYSYPSGLPFPLAAASLREQLQEIRRQYPGQKDLVVIGHSMGGMISRLLMTDSGTELWDTYFDKPPAQLAVSEKTRKFMSGTLIFNAVPHLGRVIFVSASHRGSYMATDFWGRVGVAMVGNPLASNSIYTEALARAKPEARGRGRTHLPNSIELLNPDSLFLEKVNALPLKPGIPYHSLIGDRGKGGYLDRTKPESSDGIVPYWSSHMPGAKSERIIPSGHWSHLHPLGMAEIKRILMLHLRN